MHSRGAKQGTITILIVDDDVRVRGGLRALVQAQDDLAVAGEAGSAAELERLLRTVRPTVVLLDLQLPRAEDGLAVLRRLTADGRPVVAMSIRSDLAEAARRAGARWFVDKGTGPDGIARMLRVAGRSLPN